MWNARLDESQTGSKIAGRNINNLRSVNDTTLMAETEEKLKSLLMKVKEDSEKAGLRTEFWTLWEKARVGCFERTASKHVYYLGWNISPSPG